MSRLLLTVFLLLPVTTRAADHTVLGSKLVVKNPGAPEQRKISVKAKEAGSDDAIMGDPSPTARRSPSRSTTARPTRRRTTFLRVWTGDATTGFMYKDPTGANGPVGVAEMKKQSGVF